MKRNPKQAEVSNSVWLPLVVAVFLFLCACGPRVVYHVDDKDVQSSAPLGSVTFALRTSNITLSIAASEGGSTQPSPSAVPASQATQERKAQNEVKQEKQADPKVKAPTKQGNEADPPAKTQGTQVRQVLTPSQHQLSAKEVCRGVVSWLRCLDGVSLTVTPESRKQHIYTAVPHNYFFDFFAFATTELAATTIDSDYLLPSTISVSFRDRTKDIITATGAGAAAGAPFGPYGIAIGAVAGFFGAGTANQAETSDGNLSDYICKSTTFGKLTLPSTPTLVLPVTISLEPTLADGGSATDSTPDKRQCWHLLPQNRGGFRREDVRDLSTAYNGTGWLYRIRLSPDAPNNSQKATEFFKPPKTIDSSSYITDSKVGFPYSMCRKAEIDFVWWEELNKSLGNARNEAKTRNRAPISSDYVYELLTTSIVIADPTTVGVAPFPKLGTIQFNSLCGASTSFAKDPNPSLGDTVNAALQAIQQLKNAQAGPGAQGPTAKAASGATPSKTSIQK